MAGKQPIDDWEEISDTYSVVSIPSSDDEPVLIPSPEGKTGEPRPLTLPKKITEAAGDPKPRDTKPQHTKPQDVKLQEIKTRETKPQDTNPGDTTAQETKAREGTGWRMREAKHQRQRQESDKNTASGETKARTAATPSTCVPIAASSRFEPPKPQMSRQTAPPPTERNQVAHTTKDGTKPTLSTTETTANMSKPIPNIFFDGPRELEKPAAKELPIAKPKATKSDSTSSSQSAAAPLAGIAQNPFLHRDILDMDLASRTYYKAGNAQAGQTLALGKTSASSASVSPSLLSGCDLANHLAARLSLLRSEEEDSEEVKPRNYNPVSALTTLRSVSQVLNEVAPSLEKFATTELKNSRVHDLVLHCNLLKDQVRRLLPILEGYSTFWKSSKPSKYQSAPSKEMQLETEGQKPIPLNPSFLTWMTILGAKLEEVKVQIQEEKNKLRRNRVSTITMLGARLEGLEPSFVTLTGQMVDLLPIMEIDYNVYKREALSFPLPGEFTDITGSGAGPSAQPARHQPAPPPSKGQASRLRQELHKLKDSLYDVLDFLGRHQNGYQINDMADLISSFDTIFAALSMMLSPETPGGWSGKVPSYPDDRDIDDAIIRDINDRLDDICLRRGASSAVWSYYQEEERSRGIYALADNDNLDSLRTCATVLTAILMPESE